MIKYKSEVYFKVEEHLSTFNSSSGVFDPDGQLRFLFNKEQKHADEIYM